MVKISLLLKVCILGIGISCTPIQSAPPPTMWQTFTAWVKRQFKRARNLFATNTPIQHPAQPKASLSRKPLEYIGPAPLYRPEPQHLQKYDILQNDIRVFKNRYGRSFKTAQSTDPIKWLIEAGKEAPGTISPDTPARQHLQTLVDDARALLNKNPTYINPQTHADYLSGLNRLP